MDKKLPIIPTPRDNQYQRFSFQTFSMNKTTPLHQHTCLCLCNFFISCPVYSLREILSFLLIKFFPLVLLFAYCIDFFPHHSQLVIFLSIVFTLEREKKIFSFFFWINKLKSPNICFLWLSKSLNSPLCLHKSNLLTPKRK